MADRRIIVPLFLLLLVSCAKKESDAPPPTPVATTSAPTATVAATATTATTASAATPAAAASGIATAEGDTPGISVAIKELKRSSGDIVSMKFTITNGSEKQLNFGYTFADPSREVADFASVGGVQLIDPVGKKKYFVARDSEGKCVCSRGIKDVAKGASVNVWAKFPAPPAGVDKISVIIPHFSPLDDVPISQ